MFDINIQLFGGGGSKSGLGGGGGAPPSNNKTQGETKYYTYGFKKLDGTIVTKTFKARSKKEADKKADKYRDEEMYRSRSATPTIRTQEEYDKVKNKQNKKGR